MHIYTRGVGGERARASVALDSSICIHTPFDALVRFVNNIDKNKFKQEHLFTNTKQNKKYKIT